MQASCRVICTWYGYLADLTTAAVVVGGERVQSARTTRCQGHTELLRASVPTTRRHLELYHGTRKGRADSSTGHNRTFVGVKVKDMWRYGRMERDRCKSNIVAVTLG
jgi:hypothetical protein